MIGSGTSFPSSGPVFYPCDRGMGQGGVGYHSFIWSNGMSICQYCGKIAGGGPVQVTCSTTEVDQCQKYEAER